MISFSDMVLKQYAISEWSVNNHIYIYLVSYDVLAFILISIYDSHDEMYSQISCYFLYASINRIITQRRKWNAKIGLFVSQRNLYCSYLMS